MKKYKDMISKPRMKVRVFSLQEARKIMRDMMRNGYEGVQNDSYRYCELMVRAALKDNKAYICNGGGSIRVSNSHDRFLKSALDVSRSRFYRILELK